MQDKKFINSDNPYYIGYTMLSLSLENENIYNNITKALDIATLYLDSKEISIYKKGMDNEYHLFQNSFVHLVFVKHHLNQLYNYKLLLELVFQ